jgi:hypothetical protein
MIHYWLGLPGGEKKLYRVKDDVRDLHRFLAHPSQAPVVAELAAASVDAGRPPFTNLQVCSMNRFRDELNLSSSDEVLSRMQIVPEDAETGGWRGVSLRDLSGLHVGRMEPVQTDMSYLFDPMVISHPAIQAGLGWMFSGRLDPPLMSLLSFIYDIRRFIDPEQPKGAAESLRAAFLLGRTGPLVSFLEKPGPGIDVSIAKPLLAFNAWFYSASNAQAGGESELSDEPSLWVQRECYEIARKLEEAGTGREEAKRLALWQVTCRFLEYVRLCWVAGNAGSHPDLSSFLHHESERQSFLNYIGMMQ